MKNTVNKKISIEAIEAKAVRGEDVSQYFGKNPKVHPGYGKMKRMEKKNIQRVNVDITAPMLEELDTICEDLNIPRQSLIKTMLREAMDKYFTNKKMRKA
jgi:hypothetical protein